MEGVKKFFASRKYSDYFFAGVTVLAAAQVARMEYMKRQHRTRNPIYDHNPLQPEAQVKFKHAGPKSSS